MSSKFLTAMQELIAKTPKFLPGSRTHSVYDGYRNRPEEFFRTAWPDAEEIKLDSERIDGEVIHYAEIKADATLMGSREVFAAAMAKVIEKKYPEYMMANGSLIPLEVSQDGVSILNDGTEIYEVVMIDRIGMMAAISDYTKGGPAADVTFYRTFVTVRTIGGQINYSFREANRVMETGQSLPTLKLQALYLSYLKYIDAGGYYGDPSLGLQGLLTLNGVQEYVSASQITLGMDADQMLSILGDMANTVPENTNNIEQPKIFVTPLRVKNAALHTYRALGKSVYAQFMETEAAAGRITQWLTCENFKGIDNGNDLSYMLPYDPEKLCIKIVQPYQQLDEQQIGLGFAVHAIASTALVICHFPASILKISNL